jgi:RNA polymerase sigma-70 factor (ECF subfamily)
MNGVTKIEELISLMNKAAEGEKEAFERIILLLTPKLIKVVRYYTDQPPEDILQEIWLKIWEKVSVLADRESPEYWFYTVVRHHCYDAGRRTQTKKRRCQGFSLDDDKYGDYFEMVEGALADYDDPENLTIRKETAEFIRRNIDRLQEIYSLPIYLYYFNDMPLAEIAETLGVPVSTVKWRLYAGRQLLKKELNNYVY